MYRFCQPGTNRRPQQRRHIVVVMEDEFDVVIEIPRGSRNKYEYDHEMHVMRLDRRLFSATVYPADYGFVPDTLAGDGDPLDVLVLLEDPTFPGCWVRVRAIGVFWMEDEKGPDAKIMCVPVHDPVYEDIATSPSSGPRCSTRSSTSSTCTRCWSRRRTARHAATRAGTPRCKRSPRREHARRRTPTHATDAAPASAAAAHPANQAAVGSTLNADHSSAY